MPTIFLDPNTFTLGTFFHNVKNYFRYCHLQIKSAPFLTDFHFKSAHLGFEVIGVIHRGVESGEILARPPRGGAGRPGGKNLEALVALCG